MVILDTGAYSIARANQFTRARIAAYGINDEGDLKLIRRAETVDDVLVAQVWEERRRGSGRRRGARPEESDGVTL